MQHSPRICKRWWLGEEEKARQKLSWERVARNNIEALCVLVHTNLPQLCPCCRSPYLTHICIVRVRRIVLGWKEENYIPKITVTHCRLIFLTFNVF